MAEQDVNPTVETTVDLEAEFKINSRDGQLLYTTNQAELDDCFYSVIALMSWSKTFEVGKKLKLSFSTISDDDKMKLLGSMKKWAEDNEASSNMFDQQMNKTNLAYYLSYIDINDSGINLREKDQKARMEFLGTQTEAALTLYGTYIYVFLELIRKALLSQVSVKNS